MIWGGQLVLLLTSIAINRSYAHIVLTFPPARYPPLDYLDSSTTIGPCGVPKPEYLRYTTLVAGDMYNITWRMNYVTEGGFKLAILDPSGKEIKRLTPADWNSNYIGRDNPLIHHFIVALPEDFACYGCTILLEREVKEWGNKKKFRSCADVNIVKRFDDQAPIRFTQMDTGPSINNCLDHGTITATGDCECDKLYSGNMCQYKDDCWFDADCGKGGKCFDTKSHDFPRRVCYCSAPRFGPNCELEFNPSVLDVAFPCFNYQYKRNQNWAQRALHPKDSATSNNVKYDLFDTSCYDKKILNEEQDVIYWRKIGDELEVVLEVTDQSWIGLGWRPIGLSSDCKKFPIDTDVDRKKAKAKRAVFEPELTIPQIMLFTLGQFATNPFVKRNNYSSYYTKKDNELNQVSDRYELKNPDTGLPTSNLQETDAIIEPEKTESVLHPMDCTDIVIGSAIGDRSRFGDLYTRDRSTPMADEIYYGDYSLTAAYGFEMVDGKTVLLFRKNIRAEDVADHPMGPGFIHVIFAKGQRVQHFSKVPSFADVVNKPKKFMYHGHINRVALSLKFFD